MNEQELDDKLSEIGNNLKLFDTCIPFDYKNENKRYLTDRQADLCSKLIGLFKSLRFQIKLNSYKSIKYKEDDVINNAMYKCGTPVKIRPCNEKYGSKTYFGILLGDIAKSISISIDKNQDLNVSHSFYNPAIFVPELSTVIYGYESWWSEITSEEDLNKLITDDVIKNVWYMKMLNSLNKEKGE
jgi:hypothetical protein